VLKRKKVNLLDFRYTLIPVNLPHSHWLLLVVDFIHSKVLVLDSLGPSLSAEYDVYLTTILPFLTDYAFAQAAATWTISSLANLPLQGNGYDCGLCTSLNLESIARTGRTESLTNGCDTYKTLPDGVTISQECLNEGRQRIAVELMLGELIVEC
jgi:Ulp1 family protease